MTITPPPDPEGGTLGLIALGASSFLYDKDWNNPAFKKSKEAFCAALKDEKLTIFGDRVDLLDLLMRIMGQVKSSKR